MLEWGQGEKQPDYVGICSHHKEHYNQKTTVNILVFFLLICLFLFTLRQTFPKMFEKTLKIKTPMRYTVLPIKDTLKLISYDIKSILYKNT